MTLLLKNSDGKPSLSFTMVYTAFLVSLIWFALSIFEIKHVKSFDVGIVTGFLTPLMALYFGRRWNDGKSSSSTDDGSTTPAQQQ
jgi:hypothetical protein